MKKRILFLSLYAFKSLNDGYIAADLIKQFRDSGHDVTAVMPIEAEQDAKSSVVFDEGITKISVACGPIQKTSAIKKILNLRKLDSGTVKLFKKTTHQTFDLVVCMISHCAFYKTVRFVKQRDNAFIYNMVKDIFPQNAADLGMMEKNGLLYRWFKHNENKYYRISDILGVISEKAAEVLKEENPWLDGGKIEVNPNSCIPTDRIPESEGKVAVLAKYGIPNEKTVFIYGGNLGKPQGIDFLLECIKANEVREGNAYLVIVGSGTEYSKIQTYFNENDVKNSKLLSRLSGKEFEDLCFASDVGLIFLDKRFTVPNYPSRVLSYMQARLPILFAVDAVCDAGKIAKENGYGFTCISGETDKFFGFVAGLENNTEQRQAMGGKAYVFLTENYTVKHSYNIIMKHLGESADV